MNKVDTHNNTVINNFDFIKLNVSQDSTIT